MSKDVRQQLVEGELRRAAVRCHVAIDLLADGRVIEALEEIDQLDASAQDLRRRVQAWGQRRPARATQAMEA